MNWELIFKLAIGILGLATASVVAVHRIKTAKQRRLEEVAQANGLSANPTRCLQHEDRMAKIEVLASDVASGSKARFDGLAHQLDGVSSDVKTLIGLHLTR